ncbi:hypothetical protein APHCR_0004 [Anaplasma phagocytophilum str. CR1007]|nr:hypothetical protein APHCR_0004 [Anaplasma phagocytophilum str. CR1007]
MVHDTAQERVTHKRSNTIFLMLYRYHGIILEGKNGELLS